MEVIPVLSEIDVASALGMFTSEDTHFFPSLFVKKEEVWPQVKVETPSASDAEDLDMESTNEDSSRDTPYVPPSSVETPPIVVSFFLFFLFMIRKRSHTKA